MRTPRASLVAAALAVAPLTGCAVADAGAPDAAPLPGAEPVGVKLPRVHAAEADYLYDRFNQRLLSYDHAKHSVEEASDEVNYFQYEFNTPSDLYTAGSSVTNGFQVLQLRDRAIDVVLDAAPDQGLFPLATNGDRTFLTRSTYADGAEVRRELVRLDGATLTAFPQVDGLVSGGALVDDDLFFTVFDPEKEWYSLAKVPARDPQAVPVPVADGLRSDRLHSYRGALFRSDERSVFSGDRKYACTDLCYFFDGPGLLVRLHTGQDADLVLDIVDAERSTVVATVSGVVDFEVEGDAVRVFREGDVKVVEVDR